MVCSRAFLLVMSLQLTRNSTALGTLASPDLHLIDNSEDFSKILSSLSQEALHVHHDASVRLLRSERHNAGASALAGHRAGLLQHGTVFPQAASGAYVTLLTGHEYDLSFLKGLQALAASLSDSGARFPLVVLTTEEPTPALQTTMSCLGLHHIRVPAIKNVYDPSGGYNHFGSTMAKLAIFTLPFKRVVYLDSDVVVLKNIDQLFEGSAPFQAAPDCGFGCVKTHFNAGVLVISPSNETYKDMVKQIGKLESYDEGDQGFLNSYFAQEWRNKTSRLPQKFNYLKRRERLEDEEKGFYRARVIHNVGDKPWQNTDDEAEYPLCHGAFWKAFASYETKARQCSTSLAKSS